MLHYNLTILLTLFVVLYLYKYFIFFDTQTKDINTNIFYFNDTSTFNNEINTNIFYFNDTGTFNNEINTLTSSNINDNNLLISDFKDTLEENLFVGDEISLINESNIYNNILPSTLETEIRFENTNAGLSNVVENNIALNNVIDLNVKFSNFLNEDGWFIITIKLIIGDFILFSDLNTFLTILNNFRNRSNGVQYDNRPPRHIVRINDNHRIINGFGNPMRRNILGNNNPPGGFPPGGNPPNFILVNGHYLSDTQFIIIIVLSVAGASLFYFYPPAGALVTNNYYFNFSSLGSLVFNCGGTLAAISVALFKNNRFIFYRFR